MTTIINTPGANNNDSSFFGMILGSVVLIVLAILFYLYVLPQILDAQPQKNVTEIKVEVPAALVPTPETPKVTE